MAPNMNQSNSAKVMFIVNQWIDGLKQEGKYVCLIGLKLFKVILSKSERNSYTSFDVLSNDINVLVQSTEKGNYCNCIHRENHFYNPEEMEFALESH